VGTVSNLVADKCAAKGLELVFDIEPGLPSHLLGDPLRLGQVLINYANNAVKFTQHGEVLVRVRSGRRTGDQLELRFEVQDTGIGMTEQQCQRMFESFSQADGSISRKYGGTGLGLAISKKLADLMHGSVGVQSTSEIGSTFWFTVTLGVHAEQSPWLPQVPAGLQGALVLVVDANASLQQALCRQLAHMGLQTRAVASADQAMHLLEQAAAEGLRYTLLLVDAGLLEVSVGEWVQRLPASAIPAHSIVLARADTEEKVRRSYADSTFQVLAKPVLPLRLVEAVWAVLALAPSHSQPDMPDAAPLLQGLSSLRGARILLVDDNDLNRQLGTELLQGIGIEVDTANDGQQAIEKVQQTRYDLVLMDMQMPVLDGVRATEHIRSLAAFKQLPIIAMTANAMQADQERCLRAGMNGHIAKPVEPALLFAALLRWIAPRAPADAGSPGQPAVLVGANPELAIDRLLAVRQLDVVQALNRVLNNRPLYETLLSKFVNGQAQAVTQVRQLWRDQHVDEAKHVLHTLKGTAATVGATAIADQAEAAEKVLEASKDGTLLDPLLDRLQAELHTLIAQLQPILLAETQARAEAQEPGVRLDAPLLLAKLHALRELLVQSNPEAVDWLRDCEAALRASLPASSLDALVAAIDGFGFDHALELLDQLIADLGPRP
jgi:two-component system sensor histidine kinase/response regulator